MLNFKQTTENITHFAESHVEEIAGGILSSGTYLGFNMSNEIHTLVMAFLTGLAGGFGGWLVRKLLGKKK
jgi:hypothetical protein